MDSAVLDANLLVVVVAGDPRGDRVAEQLLEWRSQGIELHAPHLLTLWTLDARLQRNATAAGFDVRLV